MNISKNTIIGIITIIVLLISGYYFHIINLIGWKFENIPGDYGDGRFNNYILEHSYLFFTGKVDSFWSANFMFPFNNVIAMSDNLLGSAPIYIAYRIINFDRETSYQLWFVSLTLLNFITATWVMYKITGNLSIAAIGGFLFAFNISLFGQYNHLQMLPRFIIPIAIYYAVRFIKTKTIKYYSFFLMAIVYQFYCGIYLGFFLLLSISLILLISFIIEFKSYYLFLKNYKSVIKIFLITIFALILLYILFKPYYDWSKQVGDRQFSEVENTIPTILSYLSSASNTLCWHSLENTFHSSQILWDHLLFPGGIAILSLLISIVFFKKLYNRENVYYLLGFLLLFIFTLTIKDFSLFKLIFKIPGFNSLRSIGRIINLELFFFAFFTVLLLNNLYKKVRFKIFFLIISILLVLADQAIVSKSSLTYSKAESQNRINELMKQTKNIKNKTCFAYCPTNKTEKIFVYNIDAMLLSQIIKLPSVNGYSSTCPGNICDFITTLDTASLYQWTNLKSINKEEVLILH